jgi:hypothetical protein
MYFNIYDAAFLGKGGEVGGLIGGGVERGVGVGLPVGSFAEPVTIFYGSGSDF